MHIWCWIRGDNRDQNQWCRRIIFTTR